MSREYLRTADDFMAAEFGRVMMLFGKALPSESDRLSFNHLMNEASAKGLNWVQGLEYVAAHRMAAQKVPTAYPDRLRAGQAGR